MSDDNKKPSEVCKSYGLESLTELEIITEQSQRTLINWHKQKPKMFLIAVLGAVEFKKNH